MIDVILAVVIGVIALIASILIPSNETIKNNQDSKYKSSKGFIFAAGGAALFMGVFVIITYASNEDDQTIFNIIKMAFFMVLGIGLIGVNIKKSKLVAQTESQGVAVAAETIPAEVMAQQIGVKAQTTVPVQTVAPQQIGIKGVPAQVQQKVPVQQIGIKQTPVQAQPQVVAAQPQPAAQPAQQPRIVVIKCPKCKGDMQINTAMLGQKIKCPHCGVEGKIG